MFLCCNVLQISASINTLFRAFSLPCVNRTIFAANSLPLAFSRHLQTLAKAPCPSHDLMSKLSEKEPAFSLLAALFSASMDANEVLSKNSR